MGDSPGRPEEPPCLNLDTPLGRLEVVVGARGIIAVAFPKEDVTPAVRRWKRLRPLADRSVSAELLDEVERRFHHYFAGDVYALEELPVDLAVPRTTRRILQVVRRIPPGTTRSYSAIAQELGYGRLGPRAVGQANARNPAPLVVPCHRVVGKDGSLVGYGGGLERKRWLLEWERWNRLRRNPSRKGRSSCGVF